MAAPDSKTLHSQGLLALLNSTADLTDAELMFCNGVTQTEATTYATAAAAEITATGYSRIALLNGTAQDDAGNSRVELVWDDATASPTSGNDWVFTDVFIVINKSATDLIIASFNWNSAQTYTGGQTYSITNLSFYIPYAVAA